MQRFAENEVVRILAGAFSGHTGRVLTSTPGSTRVAVEAFGREIVATISTLELDR